MPNEIIAPWYKELISSINNLSEELGLDDMGTSKLREYILNKSKEQFKAGNRSGIRWARMNPATERPMAA